MEIIGMRLEKTKLNPIVKNRKWKEYGVIAPVSCGSRWVSI
jgi:hypothetical protein